MRPDRVWNPGPLALESDALLTVLRGPAPQNVKLQKLLTFFRQKMAVFLCTIGSTLNVLLTNNIVF